MSHEELTQKICEQAITILGITELRFRPMRRKNPVNPKRGFVIGRTNLRTKLITIDIFTPLKREPKKISSILRVLCHEVAHHQRPPYRQLYRWRWINRQHYPKFYEQVTENIRILEQDREVGQHFS